MKKLTQMLALAGVAALCLSTATMFAQNSGGPGGDQAGPGGGRGNRGPGGPGGPGGDGGGRGNFDPAQFQQRMNERIKERLGVADEDWKAIEPLVAKVNEARMASMAGMGRSMFGGGRGGSSGGPRFGPEPSAEETALADAVEKDASKEDLKAKMAAYRKAKADKEAALKKAQDDLKKVLTTKQEAVALQMGLVN
jgi:hypothetical protein